MAGFFVIANTPGFRQEALRLNNAAASISARPPTEADVGKTWKVSQRSRISFQSPGSEFTVHILIWLSIGTSASSVIIRAVITSAKDTSVSTNTWDLCR